MNKQNQIISHIDKLSATSDNPRIQNQSFNGQLYWFKQYAKNHDQFGRKLHHFISPLIKSDFWKAAPIYPPETSLKNEIRKTERLKQLGRATLEVVASHKNILVTKDAGLIFAQHLAKLRQEKANDRHDLLLCEWAREIGKIHSLGLCLGRPHVRDTIYQDGNWIFFDFEELPEDVMPMETAQARDLYLVFHILAKVILDQNNLTKALQYYSSAAPENVRDALKASLLEFNALLKIAQILPIQHLGRDVSQFVSAIKFLKSDLNMK